MEIGDIVNVEFRTNTYSEVLIKFINNDVLQNKYTLLPRGMGVTRSQNRIVMINESITFDEIQFSSFNTNYFDVSEILIIDTYISVSDPFNPVDISNNGNIPEYTTFTYMGEAEVETIGDGEIPVIESYSEQSYTGRSTNIDVSKPSGLAIGDLSLVIIANDDTSSGDVFNTKSGWTKIIDIGSGSSDSHIGVYWRITTGSESSTERFTQVGNDEWVAWWIRVSGVDDTTPINIVGNEHIAYGTSLSAYSVTTTEDNCLAISVGTMDGGDGYPFTVSGTDWYEEDDEQSGTSGSSDASGVFGYKEMETAGATGDATISHSASSDGQCTIQFAIMGVRGEVSYETKIVPVTEIIETLPGDSNEVSFDVNSTIENNINSRYIAWSSFSGENSFYMDNFSISGIHISSPMIYNVIGNNLTCNKDEFVLNIIPEVTLTSMNYSLDGGAQTVLSGNSANIPLPETNGNHTIQVFGEGSGPTYYESEVRKFTIQYPIGIMKPNETENTIFHEFTEDFDSFNSNDVNTEPDDWTVVDAEQYNIRHISSTTDLYGYEHGTISDSHINNENYFYYTSGLQPPSFTRVDATWVFDTTPQGKDFYISYRIEANYSDIPICIEINGVDWKWDNGILEGSFFKEGVNTISIESVHSGHHFDILIYFFEMKKDCGSVEVIESMNGMNKPVQFSSNDWNSENSIERDFPEGYETGNVSFSILRESIIGDTTLITLTGTSGTMVYTLENDDLYYGTYATKSELELDILKQDVWQEFVIFFNISEGCQLFVDGVNTTNEGVYSPFSTGTPTDIDSFKIETVYHSGESYSFWFDNFLVNKIEGGFMLEVYNKIVFLDNLMYSFNEGAKKSFTDRELFSFPEDGLHNITIYGTDMYGDEYRSEFKIFTTGSTYDVVTITEDSHAMPSRWDDFTYTYGYNGGIYGTGDMESADGDYTYMNANTAYGSDTYLGYILPNGDVDGYTNWNEGNAAGDHYDDLNEYTSPDGYYIKETSWEVHDRWNFNSLTIPSGCYVSKLVLQGYVWRQNDDISNYVSIQSNCFGGFQYWSPRIGAAWKARTITGLELSQASLNAFYLDVHIDENEPPNGWVAIDSVYVQVYYKPITHRLTATINITIPEADFYELDTLYYKYATAGSAIYNNFDIYNWNTETWVDLQDFSTQSWIAGSESLTNDYLSDEYNVQIRFATSISTPDFDLRLDQMMVSYSTFTKKEL